MCYSFCCCYFTLLLSFLQIGKTERCGYGDFYMFETEQRVKRYGNCDPYDTSGTLHGTPCDEFYVEHETYVYTPYRRAGGNSAYLIRFFRQAHLFFNLIPKECNSEARKILCHHYLPPCGNETVFKPPTSVCQDVCDHLHNLCPLLFEQLERYFTTTTTPTGVTMLNCSNTGEYIAPLQHCCEDLNIKIPCTKVNGSGSLVPDEECIRSETTRILSPSPSKQPPSSSGESKYNIADSGYIGIGIAIILMFAAALSISLILLRVYKKHRNRKINNKQLINTQSSRKHYYEAQSTNSPPSAELVQRVARVPSTYIRQMGDENLVIPGRALTLIDTVGQGEFGVVYRGNLTSWNARPEQNLVAIKTLKGSGSRNIISIMEESVKMAKFNHPNVMQLIGVCIDKGPSPYLVMPYMAYGSLLSYLKKQRAELTLANDQDQELVTATQCKLLSMCLQVTKGMSYLATQQFVHRDLAARNCMIDENFVLKVADFGLSEDIYARNYFRQTCLTECEGETPVKLPVRWMAVESLHDGIFTEKTDVWSFGVTMWEIFSVGKNPYPGIDPFTLIKFLNSGGRLSKPANAACSQEMYTLMCDCWNETPEGRPPFSTLQSAISDMLEGIAGYLDFSPTWRASDQAQRPFYDHLIPKEK